MQKVSTVILGSLMTLLVGACTQLSTVNVFSDTKSTVADNIIFVAMDGSDATGDGSIHQPYRTITKALSQVSAGSQIALRAGRYQEEVNLDGIHGTASEPVIISAYNDEVVTIDGTDAMTTDWQQAKGGIWQTTTQKPIWQLFVDGEQMMPARWPNARFDTGSVYSEDVWSAATLAGSPNGVLTDDPKHHDLSSLGIDLTGGIVVANVGSFFTWTREITGHHQKEGRIEYAAAPWVKKKHYKYFVEGKAELIDTPTEWFYAPDTQVVSLLPKQGNPNQAEVRGKVRSHSFQVKAWSHVVIRDLTLFSAPIECVDCEYVTLENLTFNFGGVSRRMLGETDVVADMIQLKSGKHENGHFVVRNCEINNTDSQAIVVHGSHSVVENNLFENTDYAVTQAVSPGSDIALAGDNVTFRRNTIRNSGNSATLAVASSKQSDKRNGVSMIAELNDFSVTGFAQTDGSAIQIHIPAQNGVIVRNNWIHDTPKMGIRFDAPLPATRWGRFGLVHNNVMWNTGGVMIKGTDHAVYNNTVVDTIEVHDLVILDDKVTDKLLKRKKIPKGTVIGGKNVRTKTFNNIATRASGHRRQVLPLPGDAQSNFDLTEKKLSNSQVFINSRHADYRITDTIIDTQSVAIEDQRVATDNQYLGAYNPQATDNYWIPGRLGRVASHPIPKNNGIISTDKVDIIWRQAYDSLSERLYIAYNKQELMEAVPSSSLKVYEGNQRNVWSTRLDHSALFWRVDSLTAEGWVKGDIWTVIKNNNKK